VFSTSRLETDLLLLHAPSVYDFRERAILYGPVSDMVPSSTVFEMYPSRVLDDCELSPRSRPAVRIVNLALRMMNSRRFDVPRFLARQRPKAIGIDLHWMPHAHGALEVARIAKELHPDVPIIMGGLSSTYFHRELIAYPQVDYVLRGDSTEPPLHQLLIALKEGAPVDKIANLTWKDAKAFTSIPSLSCPMTLGLRRPAARSDGRDGDALPRSGKHPALQRLVEQPDHDGVHGQGLRFRMRHLRQLAYQLHASDQAAEARVSQPRKLVANMQGSLPPGARPDRAGRRPAHGGPEHAAEVLERLRVADLPNTIVFEFFALPPASFLQDIDRCVRHWSMEFSPESHEQSVRDAQEGESGYTTEDMEAIIKEAVRLRCVRIDIFFMIGLPAQTTASVRDTVEYCGRLFQLGDKRLSCFISPMGPFIDPGSRGFEEPERFGYRLFARTLEEHRQLLIQPTWERILNYETKWMTAASSSMRLTMPPSGSTN
jgi:hypothetical protein